MSAITRYDGYAQSGVVPPDIDPDSEPWWTAIGEGRFTLPVCRACDCRWFPATPRCPRCGSADVGWADATTEGVVLSWIVVHRALDEAFASDVPYTIVAVTLDDGARMFGRLLSGEPAPDLRVEARTYLVGDQVLVGFAAA